MYKYPSLYITWYTICCIYIDVILYVTNDKLDAVSILYRRCIDIIMIRYNNVVYVSLKIEIIKNHQESSRKSSCL